MKRKKNRGKGVKGSRKGRRRKGNTDLRWMKEEQVRNERIMYGRKKKAETDKRKTRSGIVREEKSTMDTEGTK